MRLLWLLAVYVPAVLLCILMRPELASGVAPLWGPWAGNLYGHEDCTMATQLPRATWTAVAALPLALGLAWWGRRRAWGVVPLVLWFAAWAVLALMSVANSTS